MIVFLDTNVLMDFAMDRKPFSIYSSEVIDLIQRKRIKSCTSWHSISNFYYLVNLNMDTELVKKFVKDFLSFMKISRTSNEELLLALKLDFKDFEDAMQVAAALAARADYILTRNVKDFRKSPIPAMSPKEFLEKIIPGDNF